jgi:hypothetical protein
VVTREANARCTPGPIPCQCGNRASVNATNPSLSVQMSNYVENTFVLCAGSSLPLYLDRAQYKNDMSIPTAMVAYLQEDLGAFYWCGDQGGRNSGQEARRGELAR